MMLVLVILCIVTVCVTIVCTYFLLNAEDYRWWAWIQNGSCPQAGAVRVALESLMSSAVFPGSGRASSLLHPPQFMYTCTPFTTTSSKLSKLWASRCPCENGVCSRGLTITDVCMLLFFFNLFCLRMYGLFQTSFYFGYMAVFSTALGIMCGESIS